jgi:outer membrane protein assembly factor BamB
VATRAAPGAAVIKLSMALGPPTTTIAVHGRGFGASERVDVDFDQTVIGTAQTGPGGGFIAQITVPAQALPGRHTVGATGAGSGAHASTPFLVRTDWAKFKFDLGNSGLNPYENVLDPTNVGGLALKWARWTDLRLQTAPVVIGGVVYVAGAVDGFSLEVRTYAFDAGTGNKLWVASEPDGLAAGGLAVADGVVYTATLIDHSLHAYDAATGEPLWTFQATGGVSVPTIFEGVTYLNADGDVCALDAKTGTELWSVSVGFSSDTGLSLSNNLLYLGTNDSRVVALDAEDGSTVWETDDPSGSVVSTPAVVDGVLYVGSNDDSLYAFDADTGNQLWSAPTGGAITSSPAVADGLVYVGSNDFSVYAFNSDTGARVWSTPTEGGIVGESPAVANGVVYNGSKDGRIYALDADTGEILWAYRTRNIIGDAPAVANGILYVGSFDERLYAFNLPD